MIGRKQRHAVRAWAVREIDLDTFTISLSASKEEVADAPEFRALDQECETTIAHYYYDRWRHAANEWTPVAREGA